MKWTGDAYDSRLLRMSKLCQNLPAGEYHGFLTATHLLTPFLRPSRDKESRRPSVCRIEENESKIFIAKFSQI